MIRNHIRECRVRHNGRGISMTRLAERIGVDRSYISKLEAGRRQPSARIVFAMARYFGCKVDELFEYVPDEKNAG